MSAISSLGFKWVHNYFINYGRELSGGMGPIPPSFRRGYWTQPTAMRFCGRKQQRSADRVMDPSEAVDIPCQGMGGTSSTTEAFA
jgi:hypothetical protein